MPDPIPGNMPKEEIIKNEGEVLLNQAEILCEEIDKQEYHSNLVARIIKELLRIYAKRGNYEKALQIADSQKEKSPLYQSDLLEELAVIKNSQGEDPSSLLLDAEAVIENYMSSVDINSYSNPNNFYKFLSQMYLGLAGNYLRCGKNPGNVLEKIRALSERASESTKEDLIEDVKMIENDPDEYIKDLEQHAWEKMTDPAESVEELEEWGDPIDFVEFYSIRNDFSRASEYLKNMEESGDPGTFATAKINFTCQIIRRASELLESN